MQSVFLKNLLFVTGSYLLLKKIKKPQRLSGGLLSLRKAFVALCFLFSDYHSVREHVKNIA